MSSEPDEPRGRWENRCTYSWSLDPTTVASRVRLFVCDRPIGHAGYHRGRLFRLNTQETNATVIAYIGKKPIA